MEMIARRTLARYGVAVAAVLLATVLRFLLDGLLDYHDPFTIYLCAVAFVTWFGGFGPALFTLVVGLLLGDWFFGEPRYSFLLAERAAWIPGLVYLLSGLIIVYFARAIHTAYQQAALKATEALNRQLQERVAELESLLDLLPVGVYIAEDADCNRIRANRAITTLLNVPPQTNVSLTSPTGQYLPYRLWRNGRELRPEEFPFQRSAREGIEIHGEEYDYVRDDGRVVKAEAHITPLFDQNGKPRGCIGVVVDRTKQIEEQERLAQSEKRYRSLVTATSALVFIGDNLGRCILPQEAWAAFTGLTWEEYRDYGWLKALHPDDRVNAQEIWERARQSGVFSESQGRLWHNRSQQYRYVRTLAAPVTDDAGKIVEWVGTCTDITEQVALQQALEASEERLRLALKAASLVAWEADLETGRTIHSDNAAEVLGLAEGESIQTAEGALSLIHPEDRQQVQQAFGEAIRAGQKFSCRYRIIRPDNGKTLWIENAGSVVCDEAGRAKKLAGIAEEVTEQVHLEEERGELTATLDALVDNAPVSVALFDAQLRHIRVNDRIVALSGISKEQHLGRRVSELVPSVGQKVEELLYQVLMTDQPILDVELFWRPATTPGMDRYWQASYFPVRLPSGKRLGVGIVFQEITERKRLEEALQDRAEQLAEGDRHKDEFLAVLGHELRNPLAGIVNGIQVQKMVGPDSQDAEEMREVIERQAEHMARLIDDLLDVSRISRGKIQLRRARLDFVELVRKTIANYRRQMDEHGLTLALGLPDHPLWIEADSTRISQVVGNLVNNALKFTDAGGQITVTLAAEPEENRARLTVKDTGIGMEPHLLERLFEPFHQADTSLDRSRGGLGLGLALVRGLVEMHGGEVKALSAGRGRGSEFQVRLPLAAEGAEIRQPFPRPTPPVRCHRVLLIDDRRDVLLPLKKMLKLYGQEVETADSGRSGLEKARDFQPEIVLCDIGLPDLDGYEVARALRADPALRSVYLVAVTGYGQEEDRRRALQSGFDYHVTKPVAKDELELLLTTSPRFDTPCCANGVSG